MAFMDSDSCSVNRSATLTSRALANNTSYVANGDILLEVKGFSKKPFFTKA